MNATRHAIPPALTLYDLPDLAAPLGDMSTGGQFEESRADICVAHRRHESARSLRTFAFAMLGTRGNATGVVDCVGDCAAASRRRISVPRAEIAFLVRTVIADAQTS